MIRAAVAAILLFAAGPAAADMRVEGEVVGGVRVYPGEVPEDAVDIVDAEIDLAARVDLSFRWGRHWRARLTPRLRTDPLDPGRYRWIPFEAWAEYRTGPWRLRAGRQTISWGAADSFNPADVIATRDFGSDFLEPERTGDWTASAVYTTARWGAEAVVIPAVEGARFPSARSRWGLPVALTRLPGLRPSEVILVEDPYIPDDARELSVAARVRGTFGPADVYLFGHTGTSRTPVLTAPELGIFGTVTTRATYLPLHQVGAETQVAAGEWLLKASWAWRDQATQDSIIQEQLFANGVLREQATQGVVGVDRLGLITVGRGEVDLTVEYLWDTGSDETSLVAYNVLRSNLAAVARYRAGDFSDTSVEVGWLDSLVRHEGLVTVRASRRVTGPLRATVFVDVIYGPDEPPSPFFFFGENDRAGLRLAYGF